MPYREPFAWAAVPLFDTTMSGVGGFPSPSSPLPPGMLSTSLLEGVDLDSGRSDKQHEGGGPVLVDIPGLNRVKECYSEESLQVGCGLQVPCLECICACRPVCAFVDIHLH